MLARRHSHTRQPSAPHAHDYNLAIQSRLRRLFVHRFHSDSLRMPRWPPIGLVIRTSCICIRLYAGYMLYHTARAWLHGVLSVFVCASAYECVYARMYSCEEARESRVYRMNRKKMKEYAKWLHYNDVWYTGSSKKYVMFPNEGKDLRDAWNGGSILITQNIECMKSSINIPLMKARWYHASSWAYSRWRLLSPRKSDTVQQRNIRVYYLASIYYQLW